MTRTAFAAAHAGKVAALDGPGLVDAMRELEAIQERPDGAGIEPVTREQMKNGITYIMAAIDASRGLKSTLAFADELRELVGLPDHVVPQVVVPLGITPGTPVPRDQPQPPDQGDHRQHDREHGPLPAGEQPERYHRDERQRNLHATTVAQ